MLSLEVRRRSKKRRKQLEGRKYLRVVVIWINKETAAAQTKGRIQRKLVYPFYKLC